MDGVPQCACEAVGIGAEKHAVGCFGRKRRMCKQLIAQAGESYVAVKQVVLRTKLASISQQGNHLGRKLGRPEGTAPAKYALQRRGRAVRPGIDALVAGGGDGRESIIAILSSLPRDKSARSFASIIDPLSPRSLTTVASSMRHELNVLPLRFCGGSGPPPYLVSSAPRR